MNILFQEPNQDNCDFNFAKIKCFCARHKFDILEKLDIIEQEYKKFKESNIKLQHKSTFKINVNKQYSYYFTNEMFIIKWRNNCKKCFSYDDKQGICKKNGHLHGHQIYLNYHKSFNSSYVDKYIKEYRWLGNELL